MNNRTLLLFTLLATAATAEEAPQFTVNSVTFTPPPPAGEIPYLTEEEESGEPAPQFSIELETILNRAEWEETQGSASTEEDDTLMEDAATCNTTYDICFDGKLYTSKNKPLQAEPRIIGEENGVWGIQFICNTISSIAWEYTLIGTLRYKTANSEKPTYSQSIPLGKEETTVHADGYDITISYNEDEWVVEINTTEKQPQRRIMGMRSIDKNGREIGIAETEYDGTQVTSYLDDSEEEAYAFQLIYGQVKEHKYSINQKIRLNGK